MLWKLLSTAAPFRHMRSIFFFISYQNKSHRILAHPNEVHSHREASINILDYFYYTIIFFIFAIWAHISMSRRSAGVCTDEQMENENGS